jgi:hypothetical protein
MSAPSHQKDAFRDSAISFHCGAIVAGAVLRLTGPVWIASILGMKYPLVAPIVLLAVLTDAKAFAEDKSSFHFGAALGHRKLIEASGNFRREAAISPSTPGKIILDDQDNADFVVSSLVIADPFTDYAVSLPAASRWYRYPVETVKFLAHRIGFAAKVDIATFESQSLKSNQAIEGGIGLTFRISNNFFLGATLDRVSGRQLRNEVDTSLIYTDDAGRPLTTIDKAMDRFFVDNSHLALAFMFCFVR